MTAGPRFVVDMNVGKLAKWLRVMGYDTLFPRTGDDNDLVRIALREDRILVTRDAGFGLRRAVRNGQMLVVQVEADDLRSQLCQLVRDLKLNPVARFSRCVLCNEPLHPLNKQDAAGRVPSYVFRNHCKFMECPGCRRLFWRGTHWSNMISELDQLYREAR